MHLPFSHNSQKSPVGMGRDGSLSLSQGPTTVLGHLSCQELKAFTKTREGRLKVQESSEDPGGHKRAEKASQGRVWEAPSFQVEMPGEVHAFP